tara:strand:- start:59 stop:241 length:183 start_codon:yes stop_codon:yes gene_type:complete
MGNIFSKKTKKTKSEIHPLEQIIIKTRGDCYICDLKDVYGFQSQSVLEGWSIFVCENCKT